METSVDRTRNQVEYTQSNPLFDMSLSRTDLYSFQPDDLKPVRPRKKWCFKVIVIYLILQTALNAFLLYKVFTLEALLHNPTSEKLTSNHISLDDQNFHTVIQNNSQETKNLRGHLWALESQVKSLCGDEGQLERLRTGLSLLNTTTHSLEGKLTAISLKPGPPGTNGQPGHPGSPGEKGSKGDRGNTGFPGPKGERGVKGEQGEAGPAGQSGPRGPPGDQGPGAKGDKGEPGTPGLPGEKGETGVAGLKGSPGVPGLRGMIGLKGDTGSIGPRGLPGPSGYNGTQGPPGPPGAKGEKGALGRELTVRLVPGKNRGRVEVKHNNIWGTVCDDRFDTLDGLVICKMLGFQAVQSTYTASPGSGTILLDELRCTGAEDDIFDCPHSQIGVNDCNHNEDVGVQCI
ncbi:macrophage receptor MARCO [Archocentrus centrarchus]|uniref:macrophage receptor MARCO n=1 Tax=Archocentrus centrarchus TaxID=63155 RepID=UPI0011EA1D4A|nr:macrophage receptor MARCO [Archocentrus centrarchus]